MRAISFILGGLLLLGMNTLAVAIPFGHSNGSGGTVYALGKNIINQYDSNDFDKLYILETRFHSLSDHKFLDFKNAYLPKIVDNRRYYDIKAKQWLYSEFYIFQASYLAGSKIEVQVSYDNGDRSWHDAYLKALQYANQFGYIPPGLRKPTHSITIHNNYSGLMGGSNNIIIFEERGAEHIKLGSIEEALFHEATHNYFNEIVFKKDNPQYQLWKQAQQKDNNYISYYAKNNDYEDFAESLIAYYAVKYKNQRIGNLQKAVFKAIPNRMHYFESLNLNLTHFNIPITSHKSYLISNSIESHITNLSHGSQIVDDVSTPNYSHLLWQFEVLDGGKYGGKRYILNVKKHNKPSCLDIINGGIDDQKVHLKGCGNFSGQNFSLVPVGIDKYNLLPLWQKNFWESSNPYFSCLSLIEDTHTTRVSLEECDGSERQIFTIKPLQLA